MAEKMLLIIQERLRAREAKARFELNLELNRPMMVKQHHYVPFYPLPGNSHLKMARAAYQLPSMMPSKLMNVVDLKRLTYDATDPEYQSTLD
jgi:hypothetical protein